DGGVRGRGAERVRVAEGGDRVADWGAHHGAEVDPRGGQRGRVDGEGDRRAGRAVVSAVGGGEGDRQLLGPGAQDGAGGGRGGEGAGDVGGGVEVTGTQGRAIGDGRRGGPGHRRRGLVDRQGVALAAPEAAAVGRLDGEAERPHAGRRAGEHAVERQAQ